MQIRDILVAQVIDVTPTQDLDQRPATCRADGGVEYYQQDVGLQGSQGLGRPFITHREDLWSHDWRRLLITHRKSLRFQS
jgi:hypothetical protein